MGQKEHLPVSTPTITRKEFIPAYVAVRKPFHPKQNLNQEQDGRVFISHTIRKMLVKPEMRVMVWPALKFIAADAVRILAMCLKMGLSQQG